MFLNSLEINSLELESIKMRRVAQWIPLYLFLLGSGYLHDIETKQFNQQFAFVSNFTLSIERLEFQLKEFISI